MIVEVDLARDEVARLEILEPVGAGADRLEIGRCVARLGANIVAEQVPGDDAARPADEGVGPEGRRLLELHDDGEVVDFLDDDVLVGAAADRRRRGIAGIGPGEDDIVGGEGLAVMPFDAALQLPGDRLPVGGNAVLAGGDRGGELGLEIAIAIPGTQRFVEQTRRVLVLGADGEMRIEQGRPLPPHDLEQTAAAAFGRLVDRRRLRHRHAREGEELVRQGRGEPHHCHPFHEGAAGQPARFYPVDETTQATLVHGRLHPECRSRFPDAPAILQDACNSMGTAVTAAVNGFTLITRPVCAIPARP